ncbi:MAG TPA: transposase, partial [Candidatus Baltobacteraceae bacterium]|nr:transposase [Candidatus Baltobacteraceae bacterium]
MSQGLLPYTVETVPDGDGLTSRAGLPLVLETMRALGLGQVIAQHVHVRERQSGYTEAEKIEALVLLLAAGGDGLDASAILQADGGLGCLLDRQLPSADTLRHFLYACHDDGLIPQAQAQRPAGQVADLPAENAALQGLAHVNTALVQQVAAQGKSTTATLDHDATIQESHKREALPHYQGGRGYQPTAVDWVEQDLVVADEYRDGNVGAGMATLPLTPRAFASLPSTVTTYYFRADTACYDARTLQWLADPARPGGPPGPIGFTVGADMTKELHAVCATVPEARWQLVEDRPDETVHCTDVEFTPGDWPKD